MQKGRKSVLPKPMKLKWGATAKSLDAGQAARQPFGPLLHPNIVFSGVCQNVSSPLHTSIKSCIMQFGQKLGQARVLRRN